MKFRLFLTASLLHAGLFSMAQTEAKITYPVVVTFNSQCCGVPSDSSLRKFITAFKKRYKVKKIAAFEIGPLGREGEYCLAFNLKELNKKQAAYFIAKVKNIKKLPSDKGTFSMDEKYEIDPANLPKRAFKKEVLL